jgi:hypothetical protein
LNLYVNTGVPGGKDLEFDYMLKQATTSQIDSIIVDTSADGGLTFGRLTAVSRATGPVSTWNHVYVPNIPIASPTTVFRFRAKAGYQYSDNMYLDAVRITPPCVGGPSAGRIDTVIACKGVPFKMKLTGGATLAAGLTYQWQSRPAGTTAWSALPGGNIAAPTTTINANTDFRVIVTCTNVTPNISDTTPVYSLTLAPFYYCYCIPSVNPS